MENQTETKKTGMFLGKKRIQAEVRYKYTKIAKKLLARGMAQTLESIIGDNREYVIQSKFTEYEVLAPGCPDNVKWGWPKDLMIELKCRVLLSDENDAEIGEYVYPDKINMAVPSGDIYTTPDGKTFERAGYGWLRIR